MLSITQISEWPAAIEGLLDESEEEGFRYLRRAKEEWLAGVNRFAGKGEALFGVFESERLMAIGGVNRESGHRGRLRRVYVRRDGRGKGIGRMLVQHVLTFARSHFSQVALRCDTDTADRFYCSLGFRRTASDDGATHVIDLKKEPNQMSGPIPASRDGSS